MNQVKTLPLALLLPVKVKALLWRPEWCWLRWGSSPWASKTPTISTRVVVEAKDTIVITLFCLFFYHHRYLLYFISCGRQIQRQSLSSWRSRPLLESELCFFAEEWTKEFRGKKNDKAGHLIKTDNSLQSDKFMHFACGNDSYLSPTHPSSLSIVSWLQIYTGTERQGLEMVPTFIQGAMCKTRYTWTYLMLASTYLPRLLFLVSVYIRLCRSQWPYCLIVTWLTCTCYECSSVEGFYQKKLVIILHNQSRLVWNLKNATACHLCQYIFSPPSCKELLT